MEKENASKRRKIETDVNVTIATTGATTTKLNFKGVVLVTGGAQGIGRGICEVLIRHGYYILVVDIADEAGKTLVSKLNLEYNKNNSSLTAGFSASRRAQYIHCDVSVEKDVANACKYAFVQFGQKIAGIVCNAGYMGERVSIQDMTLNDWNKQVGVNLTSTFLFAKYGFEYLQKSHGTIITIASTRALQSEANTFAYAACKGGLVSLTHNLAVSFGPDIRVNCISPGWIDVRGHQHIISKDDTNSISEKDKNQHPVGRVGIPNDVAQMVLFLMDNDKSGFITGQNIVVDGGMTKKMIYEE